MKQGKKPTLILEPQERGLFVACDLGTTEESRKMYEDIDAGLIYQMSWAFTVEEDAYNRDTHTRTITKIKKVYDVSAVDLPANPSTDISSRSWVNGVIEQEKQEFAERQKQIQRIKILTEVVKC
jgi:HK97 family phage prohead protease